MTKTCECGCGEPAPIATKTDRAQGYVKGESMHFVHGHHIRLANYRARLNNTIGPQPWTADRRKRHAETKRRRALGNSYVVNSRCGVKYRKVLTASGYRMEHRVVMEGLLGGPIAAGMHVHHRNGDGLDNRPANLELLTASEHSRLHRPRGAKLPQFTARLPAGVWSRKYDCCVECGTTDRPYCAKGLCSTCYRRRYGSYRH